MGKIFTINWLNVKSALVTGILTAVLAIAVYLVSLGDVYKANTHDLVNVGSLALLTTLISLIKSFLTTSDGKFLGAVKVTKGK